MRQLFVFDIYSKLGPTFSFVQDRIEIL